MLAFVVSLALRMIAVAAPHDTAHIVRTEEADGSVWVDVFDHGGAIRSTVRLCDLDPTRRFVAVDIDGDGRTDVVAYARDGRGLTMWRAADDGTFARLQ